MNNEVVFPKDNFTFWPGEDVMALRAEQGGPIGGDDGNLSLGSSKVAGFVVEQQGLVQMKAMTKLALDDKLRRKGAVENKTFSPTVEIQTKKIEK